MQHYLMLNHRSFYAKNYSDKVLSFGTRQSHNYAHVLAKQ